MSADKAGSLQMHRILADLNELVVQHELTLLQLSSVYRG